MSDPKASDSVERDIAWERNRIKTWVPAYVCLACGHYGPESAMSKHGCYEPLWPWGRYGDFTKDVAP